MTDQEERLSVEWGVISPIIYANPEVAKILTGRVAAILSQPLFERFEDPVCKAISVALNSSLSGLCSPDHAGVTEFLSGLPHETYYELVTGRLLAHWKLSDYESSTLRAVGGFNALIPPNGLETRLTGTAESSAKTLRHLYERDLTVDLLRKLAKKINKTSVKDGVSSVVLPAFEEIRGKIGASTTARGIGDCLETAIENGKRIAAIRDSGGSQSASWGIPELDLLCPLKPGAMTVLSAGPGCGKTSLALQAIYATSQAVGKDSVAHCSLEMSGEELATILAGREMCISPSAIREWTDVAQNCENELKQIADNWKTSGAIMVRDTNGTGKQTAPVIVSWFRERKSVGKNKLSLCVIDYLGLIDGEPREREYDTLSKATKIIKRAALDLGVPVLLLVQQNREERKAGRDSNGAVALVPEPRIEGLRGSGTIEQDADNIIFIHIPTIGQQNQPPSIKGKIIVAKQRAGQAGSLDVIFHRRHQLFQIIKTETAEDMQRAKMSDQPNESEDLFS